MRITLCTNEYQPQLIYFVTENLSNTQSDIYFYIIIFCVIFFAALASYGLVRFYRRKGNQSDYSTGSNGRNQLRLC